MEDGFHQCPGGCGKGVPNNLLACAEDWRRLPSRIQKDILGTEKMSLLSDKRLAALRSANQWYLNNG